MAETFLVVMAVLYVADLWMALPPDAVVFRRNRRGPFSVSLASEGGIRIRNFLHLVAYPVLPWGQVHVTQIRPFTLSAEGVAPVPAYTLPPHPVAEARGTVPFEQLQGVASDGSVVTWADARSRMTSELAAKRAQDQLTSLASTTGGARKALLREDAERRFDVQTIAAITDGHAKDTRLLRVLCTMMFTTLFGGLLVLTRVHLWWAGWALLAAYVLLLLSVQVAFWRVHRRLFPAQRGQRWRRVLMFFLSPAEAMTCAHVLGREVLESREPLAVAKALLDVDAFAAFAARVLRGVRFGPLATESEAQRLAEFAAGAGLDVQELVGAPTQEQGSKTYCPRCREQLSVVTELCRSCQGVRMRSFANPAHAVPPG